MAELESGDPGSQENWMKRQLSTWLRQQDWTIQELTDLLQGYGVPSSQEGEEPYLFLLDSLPEGAERYVLETEFARRVALLLDQRPDEKPFGSPSERLLYNLLMLCAGLACPDQLAEPLYTMWERRSLAGEWGGLDLRYALSAALTSNQIDDRLAPEWRAMLHGFPGEFLSGHEHDGFEGILWMPESGQTRGEPALPALGHALATMAQHLEGHRERRMEFRSLTRQITETYPGCLAGAWDRNFIELAERHGFPRWAVESLPNLFILVERGQSEARVLVWDVVDHLLRRLEGYALRDRRCSGVIIEASIPSQILSWLWGVVSRIEECRVTYPFDSEHGLQGAVSDILARVEQSDETYRELIRQSRCEILEEQGVGVLV